MFSSYPSIENRLCNEIHSLRLLLEKFCYEESFSKESKGGGPEHNMQAIPYMLQMIHFLMEEDKEFAGLIVEEKKNLCNKVNSLKSDHFMYLIVVMLVTSQANEWAESKKEFYKSSWTIAKQYPRLEIKANYLLPGCEITTDQKQVLSAFKPFLFGIRIIDLIYSVLFAGVTDLSAIKSYLASADPSIQERSLFIYEDYKKLTNFASISEILTYIDQNLPLLNWLT